MSRAAVDSHINVSDFDPNTSLGSKKFWLVYTGSISLRRTRGPAMIDFTRAAVAKLYEWDPSVPGFVLLAYKDPLHPPSCDRCGLATVDYPREQRYDYEAKAYVNEYNYKAAQRDLGRWAFLRKGASRKLVDPLQCLYLCQICQEDHA